MKRKISLYVMEKISPRKKTGIAKETRSPPGDMEPGSTMGTAW